jgi:hypothetical protein
MLLVLAVSMMFHTADPPIRLKLSSDVFGRGDRARVRVKTAADGYLVVLRADARGRIRVLFPLNPSDSAAVRGGREVEIRGRGDREAFVVDDGEGSGKVLAAVSTSPFTFDAFAKNGHWNYGALAANDSTADPEATLLGLVERMTGTVASFEYDLVTYTVGMRQRYWRSMGGWGGWGGRGWGGRGCIRCRGWFYGPYIGWSW